MPVNCPLSPARLLARLLSHRCCCRSCRWRSCCRNRGRRHTARRFGLRPPVRFCLLTLARAACRSSVLSWPSPSVSNRSMARSRAEFFRLPGAELASVAAAAGRVAGGLIAGRLNAGRLVALAASAAGPTTSPLSQIGPSRRLGSDPSQAETTQTAPNPSHRGLPFVGRLWHVGPMPARRCLSRIAYSVLQSPQPAKTAAARSKKLPPPQIPQQASRRPQPPGKAMPASPGPPVNLQPATSGRF